MKNRYTGPGDGREIAKVKMVCVRFRQVPPTAAAYTAGARKQWQIVLSDSDSDQSVGLSISNIEQAREFVVGQAYDVTITRRHHRRRP